ncbi:hypothetical protein MTDSW087_00927 [Methylobacterium dankookense]|uniref:Uncharacterized protein n=2 Tax=Methylobacterium dankookense TaxID=560405 RepID=A0A564FU96_9HYPH|nr:hypothetical protein IFDJLNFL_3355 [Methylobacterium dankookense]VUF11250.1 hypothetical protein MTDSW087_00927 [Methylobacterium dankookense]
MIVPETWPTAKGAGDTTIEFMNENAFNVRAQNAKENGGWYGAGATAAQPEAAT